MKRNKKQRTVSSRTRKAIKIAGGFLGGIFLLLIVADLVMGASLIHRWTHPEKVTWTQSPAQVGLESETFELDTPNGTVYGWVIPAQEPKDSEDEVESSAEYSDKTVLLASNYDSNREWADLGGVDYFVDLCSAGYNVVTFDWTGSGFSDGTKNVFTLDKTEELKAVAEFAAEKTGASFLAVQSVGFGCYPAAVIAADCEKVDALIMDSCYEDFSHAFYGNFSLWSPVDFAPVCKTVEWMFPLLSGVDVNEITLTDPINRLKGKSAFFIQGENDEWFGTEGAKHLYTLAGADNEASLWIVSRAGHLLTRSYDSETYASKVTEFLSKAYEEKGKA